MSGICRPEYKNIRTLEKQFYNFRETVGKSIQASHTEQMKRAIIYRSREPKGDN